MENDTHSDFCKSAYPFLFGGRGQDLPIRTEDDKLGTQFLVEYLNS